MESSLLQVLPDHLNAEIVAGTDTAKAVTPAGVAAHYVPQDFSGLDTLP